MKGMCALLMIAGIGISPLAKAEDVTVLYQGDATVLDNALVESDQLWIAPDDLPYTNGFTLKPEGACLDEICVPVKQDANNALYKTQDGQAYLNVSELARLVNQANVHDTETNTWSFAPVEQTQRSYVNSAIAPDFELKDRDGNIVRHSDFRGKKVLIHTWASW